MISRIEALAPGLEPEVRAHRRFLRTTRVREGEHQDHDQRRSDHANHSVRERKRAHTGGAGGSSPRKAQRPCDGAARPRAGPPPRGIGDGPTTNHSVRERKRAHRPGARGRPPEKHKYPAKGPPGPEQGHPREGSATVRPHPPQRARAQASAHRGARGVVPPKSTKTLRRGRQAPSRVFPVELWGFEPQTSSMPWRRATNCAIAPCVPGGFPARPGSTVPDIGGALASCSRVRWRSLSAKTGTVHSSTRPRSDPRHMTPG